MFSFNVGKYKGIIISVALFLLLDASVLLMNFYISFEIADDAEGVNIAGRQRMLSQRTMKSLYDIQVSQSNNDELERALKELQSSTQLFNQTLNAFSYGGLTLGASGNKISINAVSSDSAKRSVEEALALWQPYWRKIELLRQTSPSDSIFIFNQSLKEAITYGKQNNLTLLKLMNDLTVELEQIASSKATRLRMIQTVGITLAVINFFIIMFHFVRQLRESDEKIESARKETEEILETVNDGLFLLDKDLTIGDQHSAALKKIFNKDDIQGIELEELLGDIISSKDMNTAKNFIDLLFKPTVKENLIGDLNPLNEVEVHIATEENGFQNKFLNFSFSRVHTTDKEISHVLVTVTDITEQVKLSQELERINNQNDQQLEVLTKIMHTSYDLLSAYIENSFRSFNRINQELKQPSKTRKQLLAKAHNIFTIIHNYKGESAAMEMDGFTQMAHQFEDQLEQITQKSDISGNDFLPLTVMLSQLISQTESTQKLVDKLAHFNKQGSDSAPVTETKRSWQHLQSLADSVSQRQDKLVEVVTTGLNDHELPDDLYQAINNVTLQLIRNSISHGIETTTEREEVQKPLTGKIVVQLCKRKSGLIELSVQDDGTGIDTDKIRETAIKNNLITPIQAECMDNKQLISLIFEPDFSTQKTVDIDSGRGIGMSSVKKIALDWAGKISITSRLGVGTTICVSIHPEAVAVKEVA